VTRSKPKAIKVGLDGADDLPPLGLGSVQEPADREDRALLGGTDGDLEFADRLTWEQDGEDRTPAEEVRLDVRREMIEIDWVKGKVGVTEIADRGS
jgi:hypothetical protein